MGLIRGLISTISLITLLCIATATADDYDREKFNTTEKMCKKLFEIHKKHLEEIKRSVMSKQSSDVYVWITEDYSFSMGSNKLSWAPHLYISIDINDVRLDKITLKLKLPSGVEPIYGWGDIPETFNFDESTGILTITYDCLDTYYVWTSIYLLGLEVYSPFIVTPKPEVNPSYCAPNESTYVTLTLTKLTLDSGYDWAYVWLEVDDVKNVSIVSTTPEADWTYSYNDTDPWNGDYYSYAYAEWYYDYLDSLPEHTMTVYVQNDIDEVDIWYSCGIEKYTSTNVQIVDIITEPDVSVYSDSYTWIGLGTWMDLDPVNYTLPHGFIVGKVVDKLGRSLGGAELHIDIVSSGYHIECINKITDENGAFTVMLPPGDYWIWAEWGFVPFDDEYEAGYSVTVDQGETVTLNLVLYKVPTVKMKVEPIDDNLADDGEITYIITVINTGTKTEEIDLYGDCCVWNDYYYYCDLEWTFSDNSFTLLPGQSKSVTAYAKFVGTEPISYGKYVTKIWCYPSTSDGMATGYYYMYPLLDVKYFDIQVEADKDTYTPGETVRLNLDLTSNGGPYLIKAKLIIEYENLINVTLREVTFLYPKDYTITKTIYVHLPKYVPSGHYVFKVLIESSDGTLLLGKDGDCIKVVSSTTGNKISNFKVKDFEFN